MSKDLQRAFFRDVGEDRERTFPMRISEDELAFLHVQAKEAGVHVSVLVRRALRLTLIEKPELLKGAA